MAFYAQHGLANDAVGQREIAETRRISEAVKQIEACRGNITTNLMQWFRCVQWAEKYGEAIPESAYQAMDQLVEARRQEERLFRALFGISDQLMAIEKQ